MANRLLSLIEIPEAKDREPNKNAYFRSTIKRL